MKQRRSLFDCFNAKVHGEHIYCAKGHKLMKLSFQDHTVSIKRLQRGDPLELEACQNCPDFSSMGGPVLPEDRGWLGGLK